MKINYQSEQMFSFLFTNSHIHLSMPSIAPSSHQSNEYASECVNRCCHRRMEKLWEKINFLLFRNDLKGLIEWFSSEVAPVFQLDDNWADQSELSTCFQQLSCRQSSTFSRISSNQQEKKVFIMPSSMSWTKLKWASSALQLENTLKQLLGSPAKIELRGFLVVVISLRSSIYLTEKKKLMLFY